MTDPELLDELKDWFAQTLREPESYSDEQRYRARLIINALAERIGNPYVSPYIVPGTVENLTSRLLAWMMAVTQADITRFTNDELEISLALKELALAHIQRGDAISVRDLPQPSNN